MNCDLLWCTQFVQLHVCSQANTQKPYPCQIVQIYIHCNITSWSTDFITTNLKCYISSEHMKNPNMFSRNTETSKAILIISVYVGALILLTDCKRCCHTEPWMYQEIINIPLIWYLNVASIRKMIHDRYKDKRCATRKFKLNYVITFSSVYSIGLHHYNTDYFHKFYTNFCRLYLIKMLVSGMCFL